MSVLEALTVRDLTELLDDVCRHHHVTRDEICGRTRTRMVCNARHDLWRRLYHHDSFGFSYVEIGRMFGRHHTTVLHGIRSWEAQSFGVGGAFPSRAPMSVASSSAKM